MKRPFWILFALFLSGTGHAMSLATIITHVRQNVHDTDSTNQKYSDSVLTTYANEAQKEFNNLTWAVQTSTSYVLTAQTTYYSLPDNFLGVQKVTFLDSTRTNYLLNEIGEKAILQVSPDFENSSIGAPFEYFTRQNPTLGGNTQIAYVPIPTSSSTGTVTVEYSYQPTDMSATTDTPFDGLKLLTPYHYAIVAHMTARIKMMEGRADEAQLYFQIFTNYVSEAKDKANAQPNYLPSARGAPR